MSTDQKLFLLKLSSLLKDNKATINCVFGDNRPHISSYGSEIFVGYLDDRDALYQHVISSK
ncbi:MAG: hypothetical protein GY928_25955 [Colwellia sp.]|nr:hypothetical protein [Colwellia sp.]